MSPTVTDTAVRCWRCDAKLAIRLGPGSAIDCPRCHARNQAGG